MDADAAEMAKIPFNRPSLTGGEIENVEAAFSAGHISGDGAFTRQCQEWLEERVGCARALLTTSGTAALEMAAMLLDIGQDDEVIVPSFTFVSTVNAFVLRGARPVFIDIREDTLNLDETQLAAKITPRTRAIVPVHYAGVGCELNAILATAGSAGVPVIEDNAHGLLGEYEERPLGSFGVMAAQSFHETKNMSCGEGGALLINDPSLVDRAEIVRQKGTDRNRFFRGEVDKYRWVDIGSSYPPSDALAAILYAQFEHAEAIQEKRRRAWAFYRERLAEWAGENGVGLPGVPPHCRQPWHMFYLLMPSAAARDGLIDDLRRRNIHAVFHYTPLHLSPMGQRCGGDAPRCPVTESISERLVRLPFFTDISEEELNRVVDAVYRFEPAGA
jgi:dTDP-4-amino-4,6-dideoxygalactose transaminase